ncbi:MAG: STAS domain-containing protein [Planctomycetota bacterium]|jgi:anti-anti-sigma regulatory factor
MPIANLSEDVLLIALPEQPQNTDELDEVNKMFGDSVDRDVIVDLSMVQMLTSGTICSLIILDRLLRGAGHQLVLFNVPSPVKKVFVRTDLLTVFEFAHDEAAALEQVRSRRTSWPGPEG